MTSLGMSTYFIGYSLACLLACRSKIVGVGSQPISSCMHAFEFQSMKTKNEKEKDEEGEGFGFVPVGGV